MQRKKQLNTTKVHLYLDFVIAGAVLALLSFTLTGLTIHEWLGIAFASVITVHLLLNWQWIVATTKRIFSTIPLTLRIKYLIDATLFITMTIVIFSGLMISEVALPFVGLQGSRSPVWRPIHSVSSTMVLVIVGLHLAMSWKWVLAAIRQHIFSPWRSTSQATSNQSVGTAPVQPE